MYWVQFDLKLVDGTDSRFGYIVCAAASTHACYRARARFYSVHPRDIQIVNTTCEPLLKLDGRFVYGTVIV